MNGTPTDEMSRAGRPLTGVVHRSTRSRSLRVSLSSRNKLRGETASLTIQLDNPDEMIDKVLQVLSARFPVDTFFNVIAEQPEMHWMTSNTTNSHNLLSQALQNPSMVAQILPEELRTQWLAYASSATTHQVQSTTTSSSPVVATYTARTGGPASVYSSSSSRENTAGVAVVQGAYSIHQDTTTSMEANSSTVSMAPADHVDHLTSTPTRPELGAILGAGPSSDPNTYSSGVHDTAALDATNTLTTMTTTTTTHQQHSETGMSGTHNEIYSQQHQDHNMSSVALETPLQTTADHHQHVISSMTERFHEGSAGATQDNYVAAEQHFTPTLVDSTVHMSTAAVVPAATTTTTTTTTDYGVTSMAGVIADQGAYAVVDSQNYVTPAAVPLVDVPVTTTSTTTEYGTSTMAAATSAVMNAQNDYTAVDTANYVAPTTSMTTMGQTTSKVVESVNYVTAAPPITTTTTTTEYRSMPVSSPAVEQTNYNVVDTVNYVTASAPLTTTLDQSGYNVVDTINYVTPAAPVSTVTTTKTTEYTSSVMPTPVVEPHYAVVGTNNYVMPSAPVSVEYWGSTAAAASSMAVQHNAVETVNYVSEPIYESSQGYYNHQTGTAKHYTNLDAATGLAAVHKTMVASVSMAVQPSTSPKMSPTDSFAVESQPCNLASMASISNMVPQTTNETLAGELVREIRPSPLAPQSAERRPSASDSEQRRRENVECQTSNSSKSSGPAPGPAPGAAAVIWHTEEIQTVDMQQPADAQVYSNEGKWEEWRDDSADKETEHSAKSGSVSHNDDSSFHETAVEFTDSALRRTAEILHNHGCLEQLLMLDASSPIYQQTLHEIATKTDVDLAMISQVFGTSRLQAEFMLWCEAMYRPAPSQRYVMHRQGVDALATTSSTTTPAQTMPLVTRDFQVIDNQMIHTLASPIMTVRTTVTVEPGMLQTHTASTTTTLHRNGEEWAKDTRAVGQLTVTSPAEKQFTDTRFAVTEATPLAGSDIVAVAPLNLQTANTQFVMSAAHAEAVADQASPVSVMSITPTAAAEATAAYNHASSAFAHQHMATVTETRTECVQNTSYTVQGTAAEVVPKRSGSISERSVGSHHSTPRSHHSATGSHHAGPVSHHSATGSHHSVPVSHHSATGSHPSVARYSPDISGSHHSVALQSHQSVSHHSEHRPVSVSGSVSHHLMVEQSHHSGSHPASVAASRSERAGSVAVSQHSHQSGANKSASVKSPSRHGSGQLEAGNVRQSSQASSRKSGRQVLSSAMMTAGAAAMRTTEIVYSQTSEVAGYAAIPVAVETERTTTTHVVESMPSTLQPQLTVESLTADVAAINVESSSATMAQSHTHTQTYVTETQTSTTTREAHHIGDYEQRTVVQSPLAAAYASQYQVLPRQASRESHRSRESQKEGSRKNTEQSQKSVSQKSASRKSASQKSVSQKSASQKSAAVVSASGSVDARQMSQSSHSATGGLQNVAAAVVPTGAQLAQTANLIAKQVTTNSTVTSSSVAGVGGHAMTVAAADISTQLRETGVWKMEAPGAIVTGGVRQLSGSSHPSFEMQVDVVEDTEGPVTDSAAARLVIEQARGSVTARTITTTAAPLIDTSMVTARAVLETTQSGERSPITVTRTVVYPRGQPSTNTTVTNVTHNVASWSSVLPQQPRDIVYLQTTSPRPELVGAQTPAGTGAHTTPAKVITTTNVSQLAAAASRVTGLSRQYSQSCSPTALQQQQQVTGGWSTGSHLQMGRGRDTFTQSPIANVQTQPRSAAVLSSSVLRSTSPLAASIGHDRFFAHPSGAATTTHVTTTTRGIVSGEGTHSMAKPQPSTYLAYSEWKNAAVGAETYSSSQQSMSKHTASKSQHTTSVVSSKYAPPAAMAQINTSSPLAQLKQENPNPLLEKLALHWTR